MLKEKLKKKNSKEKHFSLFRIRALYVQRNFHASEFTNIQSQIYIFTNDYSQIISLESVKLFFI